MGSDWTPEGIEARKQWVYSRAGDPYADLRAIGYFDTKYAEGIDLESTLTSAGVACEIQHLHRVVGLGGHATVIRYTSPKIGKPIAVLQVPVQSDVDDAAVELYYFEKPIPVSEDELMKLYDLCRAAGKKYHQTLIELFRRYDRGER